MCTNVYDPAVSIETTPAGTHRGRWRDVDGRQRARTFKTRAAAAAPARPAPVDPDRGGPPARPRPMSLGAWAEQWLAGAPTIRPKTRAIYRATVDHLGPLAEVPLGRLTPAA